MMLFNDLPDDCLLTIFENFNSLEDIIKIAKVCYRWKCLILHKCSSVKYLLDQSTSGPLNSVYFNDPSVLKEVNLVELLPNLKVLDASFSHFTYEEMQRIFCDIPTIKGLIEQRNRPEQITPCYFENIEMIESHWLDGRFSQIYNSDRITQLSLHEYHLSSLNEYTEHFTKLIRLHLNNYEYTGEFYEGPMLANLKILEFASNSYDGTITYPGYHFMDHCPSLESAFFYTKTVNFEINTCIKNHNLRDLVIENLSSYNQNRSFLRQLLSKFPNLKHLAIRNNDQIDDTIIKDIVTLLPEIKLMDFRRSPNVTQNSAEYLKKFCEKSGRSIVIYYNCVGDEPADWHKLDGSREAICTGLDFMRHCFFRNWFRLPLLLDPEN